MTNFRTGLLIGFLAAAVIGLTVALLIVSRDDSGSDDVQVGTTSGVSKQVSENPLPKTNKDANTKEPPVKVENIAFDFRSPTGNIICRMDSEGALCGIGEFSYDFSPDPNCDLAGYGQFFQVGASGLGTLACADGLPAPPNSPVLKYGAFARSKRYECGSSVEGVYCENRHTGHGFAVSRERYSIR